MSDSLVMSQHELETRTRPAGVTGTIVPVVRPCPYCGFGARECECVEDASGEQDECLMCGTYLDGSDPDFCPVCLAIARGTARVIAR